MTSALERALTNRPKNTLRTVRVKVITTAPLTVQLPDGATVPALAVTGLTYTASGFGVAFISEGAIPVVLPTV